MIYGDFALTRTTSGGTPSELSAELYSDSEYNQYAVPMAYRKDLLW